MVLKSAEPIDWEAIQNLDAETLAWFDRLGAATKDGAGKWSDIMTKDDAAKLLKTTTRTLRRWIDHPDKSPYRIEEVNRRHVKIWLEQ